MSEPLLERYLGGDCVGVWKDLQSLGEGLWSSADLPAARAVALETMRRVRANVATLRDRWSEEGFVFKPRRGFFLNQSEPLGSPLPPAELDSLEEKHGRLPLSVRAFHEVVGSINFMGTPSAPSFMANCESFDPLQIEPLHPDGQPWGDDAWSERSAKETFGELPDAEPWGEFLDLFPDDLVKFNIAGVGSILIKVKPPLADGLLWFDEGPRGRGDHLFLPYLRETILERGGVGDGARKFDEWWAMHMTDGLQPF